MHRREAWRVSEASWRTRHHGCIGWWAGLETGCRQGELLSLQWREVNLKGREIRILASKAKDREDRHIPISSRLLAVLEMAQHSPTGQPLPSMAYVFGDECGSRLGSPKKAWETAVLKATATNQNGFEAVFHPHRRPPTVRPTFDSMTSDTRPGVDG